MKPVRFVLMMLPLFAAACAGSDTDMPRQCPQAAVLRDLQQWADFGREEKPARQNLVAAARLDPPLGECRFRDGRIESDIDLTFRAYRGARLGGERIELPYFAAVVDARDKVISKQNFSAVMSLPDDDAIKEKGEELHIIIPNPGQQDGTAWRILLGFQLSPEQLAFNRGEFGEPKPMASPSGRVSRGGMAR